MQLLFHPAIVHMDIFSQVGKISHCLAGFENPLSEFHINNNKWDKKG